MCLESFGHANIESLDRRVLEDVRQQEAHGRCKDRHQDDADREWRAEVSDRIGEAASKAAVLLLCRDNVRRRR
jgi:hypothetical protein